MVGTRKLARLLDHAEHAGAKIVLVGDHHQLPEIDAGGIFRGLANRLPVIELLDPAVTEQVLARIRNPEPQHDPKLARLTPTEERILAMVAEGLTNRQIGERIHLAEKTVKNDVSTILAKLEVARRAQAAAYLVEHRTRPVLDRPA